MERKRTGLAAVILVLLLIGQASISLAESPNSMIQEITYQEFLDNPASVTTSTKVVNAKDGWTNSGIFLEKGNIVHINSSGNWHSGGPKNESKGPDGYIKKGPWDLDRETRLCNAASLISKIGNHENFCVGSLKSFKVNSEGFLFFSMNSRKTGNNKGSLTLEIHIKKSSSGSETSIAPLYSAPAKNIEKVALAIFDIHSINISYDESQVLTSFLRSQMGQSNLYKIVERQYLQKILREQGVQQLDIVNQDTAVHLGKLVGARKILLGEVGQIGQTYTLTLRLVDVETGQVDKTASKACKCAKDDLVNVISELAGQLGK